MSDDTDTASALEPTVYKPEPSAVAGYRRQLFFRLGIGIPFVTAGLLYLQWHFDRERSAFILVPVLIAWLVYCQIRDERNKWRSLVFEFRDGKLTRRIDNYLTVEVLPSEVTALVEFPIGITVQTNERHKTLFLSSGLSDYNALRSRLFSWAPAAKVTVQRRAGLYYVRVVGEILACLTVFGGPLYLIYAPYRAVIFPLGLILSLAMLGIILSAQNSRAISTSTKRSLWLLLLLPILVMFIRLFLN